MATNQAGSWRSGILGFLFGFLIATILLSAFILVDLTPPTGRTTLNAAVPLQPLPAGAYSATVNIVAVQSDNQTGVLNQATVEIQPGQGRILVSLNPFVEPDTEQSAAIAASVAEQVTGMNLNNVDLIYSVNSRAQLIGGPSAGGALTVATIAAIQHKPINQDVVMTGTINPDGTIGPIGGIMEKAQAVGEAGKKIFLIPKGQLEVTTYTAQQTTQQRGSMQVRRIAYVPKTINLADYAKQQWGLQVIEISTVQDAMKYMIS